MGEYADYEVDRMIGEMDYGYGDYDDGELGHYNDFSPRYSKRKKSYQAGTGDFKWKTADRIVLDMNEMSIAHLKNAIAICESMGQTGKLTQLQQVLAEKLAESADEEPGEYTVPSLVRD